MLRFLLVAFVTFVVWEQAEAQFEWNNLWRQGQATLKKLEKQLPPVKVGNFELIPARPTEEEQEVAVIQDVTSALDYDDLEGEIITSAPSSTLPTLVPILQQAQELHLETTTLVPEIVQVQRLEQLQGQEQESLKEQGNLGDLILQKLISIETKLDQLQVEVHRTQETVQQQNEKIGALNCCQAPTEEIPIAAYARAGTTPAPAKATTSASEQESLQQENKDPTFRPPLVSSASWFRNYTIYRYNPNTGSEETYFSPTLPPVITPDDRDYLRRPPMPIPSIRSYPTTTTTPRSGPPVVVPDDRDYLSQRQHIPVWNPSIPPPTYSGGQEFQGFAHAERHMHHGVEEQQLYQGLQQHHQQPHSQYGQGGRRRGHYHRHHQHHNHQQEPQVAQELRTTTAQPSSIEETTKPRIHIEAPEVYQQHNSDRDDSQRFQIETPDFYQQRGSQDISDGSGFHVEDPDLYRPHVEESGEQLQLYQQPQPSTTQAPPPQLIQRQQEAQTTPEAFPQFEQQSSGSGRRQPGWRRPPIRIQQAPEEDTQSLRLVGAKSSSEEKQYTKTG